MDTPTTPEGLTAYDHLPPLDAVLMAWEVPGSNVEWHEKMRERVRLEMPLLARALDRAVEESKAPPGQRRPRRRYPFPWQTSGGES